MWGDERFTRLSPIQPSGQGLWVYLLSGPHTGPIPGVFVAGRAALAETLGWSQEAFARAFAEVLSEGLALFDEKTRLCFIPNAIRHNTPANPNVVKSWRAHWLLLPESPMREHIYAHVFEALTEVSEAFGKAFEEACGKASDKPSPKASLKHPPKQEAGNRKQEDSEANASSSGSAKSPRASRKPPDSFVVTPELRAWHAEKFPQVDIDLEAEKFRDTTFKNPITDWSGTFRNWIRKAVEFAPRTAGESAYQRGQREQMQRAVPSIAAKAPGAFRHVDPMEVIDGCITVASH